MGEGRGGRKNEDMRFQIEMKIIIIIIIIIIQIIITIIIISLYAFYASRV